MKLLNDKELSKITINDLEAELAAERVKSARLQVLVLELRMKCLASDVEKAKNQVCDLQRAEAQAREARSSMLQTIAKKKGLAPGWGFNPDNGEIIEGEEK